MTLVNSLVEDRMMQSSVNPIDEVVGEEKECDRREGQVEPSCHSVHASVQHAVSTHIAEEDGSRHKAYWNEAGHRDVDFLTNLSWKESWMLHDSVVEEDVVGSYGEAKVEEEDAGI